MGNYALADTRNARPGLTQYSRKCREENGAFLQSAKRVLRKRKVRGAKSEYWCEAWESKRIVDSAVVARSPCGKDDFQTHPTCRRIEG